MRDFRIAKNIIRPQFRKTNAKFITQQLGVLGVCLLCLWLLTRCAPPTPEPLRPFVLPSPHATLTTPRSPTATLPIPFPTTQATDQPTNRLLPSLTPLSPRRQGAGVVLVTLSGAPGAYTERLVNNGVLPTVARFTNGGASCFELAPIEPAVGSVTHASLLTGASPARTGIVADHFRKLGQAIGQTSHGLDQALNVEPIWRSAMRHGLTTATIGYAPSHIALVGQRANWMVTIGAAIGNSAQHILKFENATGWREAPRSFSAAKEARLAVPLKGGHVEVFVLALDTTNDQKENYDTWLLNRVKAADAGAGMLRLDTWATVVIDPLLQGTASFKVVDANPANFVVYQSAVMINQVAPSELAREVTQQFGAPPAPADSDAFERGWIDAGTYLQMAERQLAWQMTAATYLHNRYKPDLLVLRLTTIDDTARELLLLEPRQPNFSARAPYYASIVKRAYEVVDAALNQFYVQMDFNAQTLMVVSEQGLAPVHTVVNLNRVLLERRWLTLQRNSTVLDTAQTKAYAEANGGMAHIYINLKGRDPNGAVELADYDKLQGDIIAALKGLNDPVTGLPIFVRVQRKQDLGALAANELVGDVMAQARNGFAVRASRDRPVWIENAPFLGASGYDATRSEMRGFFVAYGAGAQAGARTPTMSVMDVAPLIAKLLRFEAPAFVEGKIPEGILK
jgi:predicted AlkP superfamily phosphohydrolase/phosphomutase